MIRHPGALLLFILIFSLPAAGRTASSPPGTVRELAVDQIRTLQEMKAALDLLDSSCREAEEKHQFPFPLQQAVISKSGECISRIVELAQQAPGKDTGSLFATNRRVITAVLRLNRQTVEYLQETRLDQMEDTAAFFSSSEWQQPHYLISLASYWLSWNGYYRCLLAPGSVTDRRQVLVESIEGFSRSLIDFEEESITVRSLFGRALCYKELQQYERAIHDFTAVIQKVKPGDTLYQRCRYEKASIGYLTGNYQDVLREIEDVRRDTGRDTLSPSMDLAFKRLRFKTIIARASEEGKETGENPETLYRAALHELNSLPETDERLAGELYRYATRQGSALVNLSCQELGPIGCLATADWYLNRGDCERAIPRYQQLTATRERLIKGRMDDLYYSLGYCYCQQERWRVALSSFASLFERFPRSNRLGKAACMNYAAAAHNYRDNPDDSTYATFIEATNRYLEQCGEPGSKSEAWFQLGKYNRDRGKGQLALKAFSRVDKDSPHYAEAHYYLLQSSIGRIESLYREGKQHSASAEKIYRKTRKQLEDYQSFLDGQGKGSANREVGARIALLQAKAYLFGPGENCTGALGELRDFENRFAANVRLATMAKGLRIECYRRLQQFTEARRELSTLLKEATLTPDQWAFLKECASTFYEESERLRNSGDLVPARRQAEIALMVYERLSSSALENKSYRLWYESMRLRMAELYRQENRMVQAEAVYRGLLERNPGSADAIFNLGLLYEEEERWENALATWRELSGGLKTGTYYWFEARYHTAHALNQLGKRDKACEVTTMVEVLHPTLRDEQFRKKFMALRGVVCNRGD